MLDQHHSLIRSCSVTQIGWLVLRVSSIVPGYFTCFLVYCQNYVIPVFSKCNIPPKKNFLGFLCVGYGVPGFGYY